MSIKDILNEAVVLSQNINTSVDMAEVTGGTDKTIRYFNRNQITKSYKPGRYFSAGITYKF
ncbi:MAG: hypothetical protein IPJ37_23525 [Bacteroidales bacterium]|nr:hypothetical protein [Bacteroidales bacterium]